MRLIHCCLWLLLGWVGASSAQDVVIYDDQLRGDWENFSFGGNSNFAATAPVQAGTLSISHSAINFSAVSVANTTEVVNTSSYPRLRFFIHGGTTGGQDYSIALQLGATLLANVPLNPYINGGAIVANQWREVTVVFGSPPLSFSGNFDRISIQSQANGAVQPLIYLDELRLLAAAPPVLDPIFDNGFESAPVAANQLLVERDVTVDAMTSDRFTWRDANNQPRQAVLAHNTGQTGPGGTRGGELREYRYQVGGNTRVVRAPPTFAGGFGYLVSHRSEGTNGIAGDDSPLGHGFTGTFTRVFEGRHHAIFRFNMSYPQWSRTNAAVPNTRYLAPVTVEWMFSTGRDHPLFAQSWDLSAIPVNAVETDLRAPYGELLFDGAATAGAHSEIAGVGWGDLFKFNSTTNPLTFSSAWTWNQANTVPYVKLHTTNVDATMGTVQTQTKSQQDAGGYFGVSRMNTTSAAGNACTVAIGGVNHLMPCAFNWPYQSINYSLGGINGTTNNTRLAWGSNFGFLGQTSYPIHGSDFYGGPLAGNPRGNGWPRQGMSAFVVLGTHSSDPVGAQVNQVEVVQATTLTATVGTVRTSGPAGVNRPDTVNYAPAGWNHVYAAFALNAQANALDANFAVSAGSLRKPLLIVSNYTAATTQTVRLNGVTLQPDVDFFASLRSGPSELWLTLNRDLSGATNRIQISP